MKTHDNWRPFSLEELSDGGIANGVFKQRTSFGRGVPLINVMDTYRSLRVSSNALERVEVSESELRRFSALPGDLFFVRSSLKKEGIGNCCILLHTDEPCVFDCHLMRLRPNGEKVVPEFLALATTSQRFRADIISASGTTTMTTLSQDQLGSVRVVLPPLPEQRKIADILSTWDEAFTQLDALIEAQERRKKALMQQLLTGKKRFPGFKGKWKKVGLGDVAENVADQNKGRMGTTSLYGVTKADGVVPMRDHVKGESFDRCKRVETDWFAYNPMRINIGSIARWQGAETVMVSGDYVVFRCHPDKLLPAYLDHLRQSWMWQSFVTRGGNGSVRIRIYFSDLAEFTFPCPPLEEQRQIAAFLDTADQQLTLLRTQRTALDQQKRGLMQRLLTGKLRVKVTEEKMKLKGDGL